jgi:hypothetical protein
LPPYLLPLQSPELKEDREMRARKLLVVAGLLGILTMAVGCSSEQSSTTTTRTSADNPSYASNADSNPPPQPAATTTTTTTTNNEPDSVLGAAFHLVGTIILLPFRIIGLVV